MAENIAKAQGLKDIGNDFFKQSMFSKAKSNYGKALAFAKGLKGSRRGRVTGIIEMLDYRPEDLYDLPEELDRQAMELEIVLHQNIAMCFIKMDDPLQAIVHCNKALEQDNKATKALLRKAEAQVMLKNYHAAQSTIELGRSSLGDDGNSALVNSFKRVQVVIEKGLREELIEEKKRMAKMFK